MVELYEVPVLHDENAIRVNDGSETVCHYKDSAVLEALSECLLDEVISFEVNIGCGFVEYQYFCLPRDRPTKAK